MIEHKKMYKAGKRWLTGSLTLLAGGVFLQSMGTQAAADSVTENWHANSVTEVKEAIKGQDLKNYVLAKGDTVWAISQATGMSVQEIATTFHLQDVDHVLAGQTLMLTGQEAQALAQKLVRADETAGDTQSSQTASSQVEETNDSSSVADQTTKEQAAATASANAQAAADQAAKEQAAATASANAQAAADQAAKEQAAATASANAQAAADQAAKEQAAATASANAQAAADQAAKEQAAATASANAQAAADQAAKERAAATAAANAQAAKQSSEQAATHQQQPQLNVQPAPNQGDATANAMNQLRSSKGLAPVQWDANLAAQARNRAQQIYNNGHQIPADHFHTGNEVIAMGFGAGSTVVQAWYNETNMIGAPGHRNWLMNAGWSRVGFAQVGDVIVGLAG